MSDGWKGLEEDLRSEPELQVSTEDVKRRDLFYAIFKTPRGQEILRQLRERTINKPCIPEVCSDGMALGMLTVYREGENNLYRWIIEEIKAGELQNERRANSSNGNT